MLIYILIVFRRFNALFFVAPFIFTPIELKGILNKRLGSKKIKRTLFCVKQNVRKGIFM